MKNSSIASAIRPSRRIGGAGLLRDAREGVEVGSQKFFAKAGENLRMNEIGVIKTHLDFCRVNVDVVILVRHPNKYKRGGEPAWVDCSAIRLFDCVRDEFVAYESAVEEYVLQPVACGCDCGFTQKGGYVQALFIAFGFEKIVRDLLARIIRQFSL